MQARTYRQPGRPVELEDASELHVRLSADERRRLEGAALRARVSQASLVRQLVRRGLPRDLPPPTTAPTLPAPDNGVMLRVIVSAEDHHALRELSRETGTSASELVRRTLRDLLAKHAAGRVGSKT